MTIEIISKYYDRFVLNKERMTWYAWISINTVPPSKEKFEGIIQTWPVVEENGVETLITPGIESYIKSWREIPDEPEPIAVIPELPVLPSASVHDSGRAEGEEQSTRSQLSDEDVRMPSPPSVPSSGTDWIK